MEDPEPKIAQWERDAAILRERLEGDSGGPKKRQARQNQLLRLEALIAQARAEAEQRAARRERLPYFVQ